MTQPAASLSIKEIQIKSTVSSRFTPVRMTIIQKMEECTHWWRGCWWECIVVQPLHKIVWRVLKHKNATRSSQKQTCRNPTIVYIYPEDVSTKVIIETPAPLCLWQHCSHLLNYRIHYMKGESKHGIHTWAHTCTHTNICNGILFGYTKEIPSFAGKWMQLEDITFNEISQMHVLPSMQELTF